MTDLPAATALLGAAPAPAASVPPERVVLDYDARLMRRKRLMTEGGRGFLVDLPTVTNLDEYWGFALADGTNVQIIAAEEPVLLRGEPPHFSSGRRATPNLRRISRSLAATTG